jgi:low affinity Fe/Cu permease
VFQKFSEAVAQYVGTWWAFTASVGIVVVWGISGPIFGFSDTWQLVINTATTVVTFWLVFIIQYTQNRDNRATHLKLDELIKGVPEASDELISLEKMTDDQIDDLYRRILRRRRTTKR